MLNGVCVTKITAMGRRPIDNSGNRPEAHLVTASMANLFSISPNLQIGLLSLGSAVFYTCSMAAMKLWTQTHSTTLLVLVAITIILGTWLEIMALQVERLGMIYVTILACEVGLIALISCLIFGESFTTKEVLGCLLIVIGTALAWA